MGKYNVFRKDEKGRELYKRVCASVSTVDAFQGDERKKVFVSLTRSNKEGKIGFLEEERRLGVAIGRAQEELYIFGDMSTVVENNDNPESKEFFTKMRDLILKSGLTISEEPEHRRRRRKGGHGRSRREKRLYRLAMENKCEKARMDALVAKAVITGPKAQGSDTTSSLNGDGDYDWPYLW